MPSSVRTTCRFAFLAALVAAFYLALMPEPDIVKVVSWQDKIEHAVLFAALALLAVAGWPRHPLRIAAGLLLYGAAMEIAQSQTGYRVGDPWDWVADAVGLFVLIPAAMLGRRTAQSA
ncbi:VanZ family protein [Thauera linaloolentis]|uniref:VanZ family protein n=1 Tax=Thauera linaloolentis (strain DSM 12138 / JCM 21573 / CCUG 41526 / CIP 105981 / IAM 15112 / NBRC 102519 / 47Lol) TaxID=1123367 RepID=N6YBN6_THAL4|nr:VanZ family protein [Thauera linaloolentis]ENO88890.1 VanZ family protein [Thauera linaloolentis 47Lol = DSM 12138]MCM8564815.1 VanZ family protein [Thauera linaloolentis]